MVAETRTRPEIESWLLLAVGLGLLLVSNGNWIVPAAVWLSPIFILRFLRQQKSALGIVIGALLYVGVYILAWRGMIMLSDAVYYLVAASIGLVFFLPFLVDRLIAARMTGFLGSLVFPLAYTTVEYVGFRFTPYGTWGSLAYTQFGNLPFMQLASVTGIYGLTFLITWFASVVNWAWEQEFEWSRIRKGTVTYAGVMAIVLLSGGTYLAFLSPQSDEVKVAGVQSHIADKILEPVAAELAKGDYSLETWAAYFAANSTIIDDLFSKSATAAQGGAKIVSWAENPVMIPREGEPAFLDRGKAFAKQEQIYLALNYSINLGTDPRRAPTEKIWSSKVVLVGPSGEILSTYRKTILVPGMEATLAVSGNDDAIAVNTPYGRISSLICYDNDFPAFVRNQIGREGVDVLLDPSGDWRAIDPYHTNMMAFRAIENGFSVVRVTGSGLSAAYDYQGRTLATMDYFKTEDKVFTTFVPQRGIRTVYSKIGDVFAWLCIAGLVVLVGLVFVRRRHAVAN